MTKTVPWGKRPDPGDHRSRPIPWKCCGVRCSAKVHDDPHGQSLW